MKLPTISRREILLTRVSVPDVKNDYRFLGDDRFHFPQHQIRLLLSWGAPALWLQVHHEPFAEVPWGAPAAGPPWQALPALSHSEVPQDQDFPQPGSPAGTLWEDESGCSRDCGQSDKAQEGCRRPRTWLRLGHQDYLEAGRPRAGLRGPVRSWTSGRLLSHIVLAWVYRVLSERLCGALCETDLAW